LWLRATKTTYQNGKKKYPERMSRAKMLKIQFLKAVSNLQRFEFVFVFVFA